MSIEEAAAILWLLLHGPDGRVIYVNAAQVTSMHAHRVDAANKLYVNSAQCLLHLVDGKNVAVVETCDTVRAMMAKIRDPT